jgi:hypothetical protein
MRRLLRRGLAALGAAALVVPMLSVASVAAKTPDDFPSGFTGYHTYAETVADIDAVIAAHPTIAAKYAIGQSYEGRTIWVVKISDNVGTDENEPEVLMESLHHAREHLTVEQALEIIHLLADNYRASPTTELQQRVSAIVRTREIWIVPMLNPDGGEYDISSGDFRNWRRNTMPIPNSRSLGVDLNRNWAYKWGCCNGSSGQPGTSDYRGPSPWFAPEVVALRDFVLSRRVGDRQQITASISWHSFNEQIMWPYGYTKNDVPKTMTADDHATFVSLGTAMAARPIGSTAISASSRSPSRGIQPTTPTSEASTRPTRSSPPRPRAMTMQCCTSSSRPIVRIASSRRSQSPTVARSTTISRRSVAGRSTPMAPTPRCQANSGVTFRRRRRTAQASSRPRRRSAASTSL